MFKSSVRSADNQVMAESIYETEVDFEPPSHQPVRPSWNPAEEARRRAEMEAAALQAAQPKRRRGKTPPPPPVDPTITTQIRMIAESLPDREHAKPGGYHGVVVPRAICVTGFFLGFAFPAAFLYLNHLGHADLVDGRFEPDEFATRISMVMLGGAAVCMLIGWLWWGVAAALNARHRARWAVSPWYVTLTYLGVAALAVGAGVSERWLGENVIYARACALALAVMMYFSTLATYRRTAQSVNSTTTYFTRLILVPWFVVIGIAVLAWFWKYLPTQAILGAYIAIQLVQGLYGLTMYQAMASLDRACAGTQQMRPDDQEFAKFLKVAR